MQTEKLIQKSIYDFSKWTINHIQKIPSSVVLDRKLALDRIMCIPAQERTYENTIYALESAGQSTVHDVLLLNILMNLSPKDAIRKAALQAIGEFEKKSIDIEYNPKLYNAALEYIQGKYKQEKKTLHKHEIKLLEDMLLQYQSLGFALPKEKQKLLKNISKKLSAASNKFSFNINATESHILCSLADLDGLPQSFVSSLARDTKTRLYIVTTQTQHYAPFMKLATSVTKRKELATLALQKGGLKNIQLLRQMVSMRNQAAKLLGFKNHIDKTLALRMARNEKTVLDFVSKLYKRVVNVAKKEKSLLEAIKANEFSKKSKLEFYDTSYYANKLYEQKADLDTEKVKQYFETSSTVQGMLNLYSKLFSVNFSITKEIPVWDKKVYVLKLTDKKLKQTLGYIYMDLYPRSGKYGHAMVTHATNGYRTQLRQGQYTMPICALVCNFTMPSKKTPSLLSLRDVETLFHEFGHALHTVLTEAEFESQSGTNVTWDFVEAPSQMLENFVYEPKNLKALSRHYITGNSLDSKTIAKVVKNKNFMAATQIARQLLFCRFDFAIHGTNPPKDIVAVYNNLYKKITNCSLPKDTYFPAGFGHMDGYDAGYYSYLWALVYAQDMYSVFSAAKNSKDLERVGVKYRTKILAAGSTRNELLSVKDFLGRPVSMQSFFDSQGI